jgi:L-alanine-DL-glutamate epimerase-like enolase superfamily enzyme
MVEVATIAALRTRLHRGTLVRPWGADVTTNHVIEVEVEDSTGAVGIGFSWTPSIGAHAVRAMLDHDIRDAVLGGPADPEVIWPALWAHLHEAGSGGVTTIAMAGLDLALWDLAGRRSGRSLAQLLGRRRDRVPVYGSGVNLHYDLDELVAQAQRWVAAGYPMVKIKVGGPDLAEDCERVAAVREVIGPDRGLMIDANQRWDLDRATTAMTALQAYEPRWIEEPLRADDLAGHAELRRRISTPVALGENLHTVYRFRDALDLGACDVIQPNVVRVGGVTPFLRIAALAVERGAELHPHLLPEISGQLALTLEQPCLVEDVEDASLTGLGLLADSAPVVIQDGWLSETGVPGLGLRFQPALAGVVAG